MAGGRNYTLNLNFEQRDAVETFINMMGWTIDISPESTGNRLQEQATGNRSSSAEQPPISQDSSHENPQDNSHVTAQDYEIEPRIPAIPGEDLCNLCLCQPCVTTKRQRWLGEGQKSCRENSGIRKKMYLRFWQMLDSRGIWRCTEYQRRRKETMERDAKKEDDPELVWMDYCQSEREIMPICVLKLVRSMYPNLPGHPYMEHKWV